MFSIYSVSYNLFVDSNIKQIWIYFRCIQKGFECCHSFMEYKLCFSNRVKISYLWLHSERVIKIYEWCKIVVLFSTCRTTVTLLRYTLSVLNADSSVAALSRPSSSVIKETMKSSQIKYCNCKAYKVRMLWTKDMKEFNSTVIQESVSKAWVGANDGIHCKLLQIFLLSIYFLLKTLYIHFFYNSGFGLIIPTSVINSEAGYVAGSG